MQRGFVWKVEERLFAEAIREEIYHVEEPYTEGLDNSEYFSVS